MFQWYDEGASLRELDRRLQARGITPPDHHRTGAVTWSLPTLRGILMNENYVGVGYVWKTDRREIEGRRVHVIKPREEWIQLPDGTYPTVIDEAQFGRVQAAPQIEPPRQPARRRQAPRPWGSCGAVSASAPTAARASK